MALWQGRSRSAIVAFCVFVLTLAAGLVMVALGEQRRLEQQRHAALNKAHDYAAQLRATLAHGLGATHVLAVLLRQGEGEVPNFEAVARELLPQFEGLSALLLAPGGVIAERYPPEAHAPGIPERLLAARDAAPGGATRLALAGPFALQGVGKALVGRLPVFIGERFWGFTAAVMPLAELDKAARLSELGAEGYRYEVFGEHPDTREPRVLFRSAVPLRDPVTYEFEGPSARWALSLEPQRGWVSWEPLAREAALVALLALLAAGLAYRVRREPERLRRLVQARTEALQRSRDELRLVTDAVPAGIVYADRGQRLRYSNQTFAGWLGLSESRMRGRSLREVLGGAHEATFGRCIDEVLAGRTLRFESRLAVRGAPALELSTHFVPDVSKRGEVVGFFALLTDVTELKAKEAQLHKLSTAVIQNPASVVITDLQGNIEYVNPKFEALTGYSLAEVKGRKPSVLKSGSTPAALYEDLWRTIGAGRVWRGEIQNRAKSGALFWESQIIAPVKDAEGAITHFIAVKEDVTARKDDERHLRKLNHTLKMVSACNEALVRSADEAALTREVCRLAVELGDYPLAWVGELQEDAQRSIRPMAFAGADPDFMRYINASALDVPTGRGATGTAVRTGSTVVMRELLASPHYAPWRELFEQRGYRAAVAFPLANEAGVFGALTLYSCDAGAFDAQEAGLLEEMANDLAYGITALRTRAGHRMAMQALEESEERFRSITHSAQDAIIVIDEAARITYWNPAAERMFGPSSAAALGRDVHDLITPERFRSEAKRGFERFAASVEGSASGKVNEFVGLRADGSEFPFELAVSAVRIRGRYCAVGVIRDITERRNYERELERQATRDPLTGLPNRNLLRDRIEQALASARREAREVAVMVADLDRFKNVNDSLGHFAGDGLLQAVARRLTHCLREGDTVARFGGDEFAIVVPDVEDEARLTGLIQRIVDEVSKPVALGGREVSSSCSIGIALYPKDGADVDTLLRNADAALYRAKEGGRNGYHFFTQDLNAKATERLSLEVALRRALAQDQLCLHYQPQFDLKSGRAIGLEALLRWRHPELGSVPPGRFIPVAEDSGLIVPIGDWVMREACRQAMAWQAAGLAPVTVAVNLSAVQFRQKSFVERVERILEESGLPPQRLELELTESIVMHDVQWVTRQLYALKARGVQIAIDDFGTGYSSLKYLRGFPVDRLKIDMAFVREIDRDPGAAAISALIIDIGHALGMQVIAEGVETSEEAAVLRSQGCDQAQGHFFSVPLPGEAIARKAGDSLWP